MIPFLKSLVDLLVFASTTILLCILLSLLTME
jgi:hypothetical protein